ncbi:MAG: TspO/MBR family protein [Patescibacteria group bacterium]
MKLANFFKLVIAIVIVELAGAIGAIFTVPVIPTWYAALIKSPLNPPSWVFAPVWNILFIIMGMAAFLVWKKGLNRKEIRVALIVFIIQLVLNSFWSIIFFGLRNPGAAFLEIIFLWLAILATIIAFYKVSRDAAYLLIPYILWVTFAAYLTFSVWQLNKNTRPVITPPENNIASLEAKICPDGSFVGCHGPNCELAACQKTSITETPDVPAKWITFADSISKLSFDYPRKLGARYIYMRDD